MTDNVGIVHRHTAIDQCVSQQRVIGNAEIPLDFADEFLVDKLIGEAKTRLIGDDECGPRAREPTTVSESEGTAVP